MRFLRSGRPSLDLAWTVRFRNVWPTELLVDTGALHDWLQETYPNVIFEDSLDFSELLERIRPLREALYGLVMATTRGDSWLEDDLLLVNDAARGPRFVHALDLMTTRPVRAATAEQVLSELAVDAIDVLNADRTRLKNCQGPLCALPFLDESRGATRRWCATQRCGNRVNTKAYRDRSRREKQSASDGGSSERTGPVSPTTAS